MGGVSKQPTSKSGTFPYVCNHGSLLHLDLHDVGDDSHDVDAFSMTTTTMMMTTITTMIMMKAPMRDVHVLVCQGRCAIHGNRLSH